MGCLGCVGWDQGMVDDVLNCGEWLVERDVEEFVGVRVA